MTDPKDFQGTDKDYKELAKQVQQDTEDSHKQSGPSAESLAEGVE